MDGSDVLHSPVVFATACVRISPTQLRVTWASAPATAIGGCALFYNMGNNAETVQVQDSERPGRGNLITDNYASIAKPAGANMVADLGAGYGWNYPVATTPAPGIAFS